MCGVIGVFFISIVVFSFQIIQAQNFNYIPTKKTFQHPTLPTAKIVAVHEDGTSYTIPFEITIHQQDPHC
jgi:hypothetical protein